MPHDERLRAHCERVWTAHHRARRAWSCIGWRDVPIDNSSLSRDGGATEPLHRQVFIGRGEAIDDEDDFERKLYLVAQGHLQRRSTTPTRAATSASTPCRCRSRTLVYKGMFLA